MDLNIALVAVLILGAVFTAVGAHLNVNANQRSRAVPVIRQLYRPDANRRYR